MTYKTFRDRFNVVHAIYEIRFAPWSSWNLECTGEAVVRRRETDRTPPQCSSVVTCITCFNFTQGARFA